MKTPLKIQLALQGGGAKIAGLLAAMEAVEKLCNTGRLQVTRIAGTSAGSIVACLFAAKIPLAEVKAYIRGGIGQDLVNYFGPPSFLNISRVGLMGSPLWKTDLLGKYLGDLFAKQNVTTIADLEKKAQMEVLVVAADLRDARKVVAPKESNIVNALLDSCGLPFCFRTWNRGDGPVVVDGGLCENLPITELRTNDEDGPIVAISFKPTPTKTPQNIAEFSMALLNTAISNSMNRARAVLPPDCIFEIDTPIGTFDFARAINEGLAASYDLVKLQSEQFFQTFITGRTKPQTVVQGDPWTENNPRAVDSMRRLGEMYFATYALETFKYLDCTLEVTAHGLRSDTEVRLPDETRYSVVFQPLNRPIQCISISLMSTAAGYLGRTSWDLRDKEKNLIQSFSVPAINEKSPFDRELIHFFKPALEPDKGPFRLVFKDEAMALFESFAQTGQDDLVLWPRRAEGNVNRIRIVLHVPKDFKKIYMVAKSDPVGRSMTSQEMADFGPACPYGFYSLGWIGEDVGGNFGVDLRMN